MSRNSRPTTRQSFRAVRARRGALVASRGPPSLRGITTIALSSVALLFAFVFPGSSLAATAIGLGTADSYGILAGAGVTNTGPSVVNGDLGTHPTSAVTGFGGAPNGTVNGVIHQADAAALQAKDDLTTAFNNAAGQGPTTTVATDLGGLTLTPGVYTSITGDFGLTGPLTLDGQGDPDAVFIFKSASTLVTATGSSVNLINSAQSCRVYWQLGSSATLGSSSSFVGNIFAQDSISVNNAVTVDGRLLARSASVTLINDTITRSQCAPATTPPPTTPTPPPTTPTPPGGGGPGGGGPWRWWSGRWSGRWRRIHLTATAAESPDHQDAVQHGHRHPSRLGMRRQGIPREGQDQEQGPDAKRQDLRGRQVDQGEVEQALLGLDQDPRPARGHQHDPDRRRRQARSARLIEPEVQPLRRGRARA